jgi:hypothetical protein
MQKKVIVVKKPKYPYAGKETITEIIGRIFPRKLIPTKRMGAIFGGLFLLALIIAVFQFPLDSLISGNPNISITVGYPYPFLDFGLTEVNESSPLRIRGLAIDLLLYLIISYIADILLTLALKNPFIGSKKQIEKRPTVFKNQRQEQNISDKVTKKVFQKESLSPKPQQPSPAAPSPNHSKHQNISTK